MKLYFGNAVTAATTIMIAALLAFIGYRVQSRKYSVLGQKKPSCRRVRAGGVLFAAARDGLDKTLQNAIDGSCQPGIFKLISVPTIVGAIGALAIVVALIATPIAKSQSAREIWFYVMSCGVVMKILTMEIARIFA